MTQKIDSRQKHAGMTWANSGVRFFICPALPLANLSRVGRAHQMIMADENGGHSPPLYITSNG